MNILAYFPGIDYNSSDQFGRQIHVKELILNLNQVDSHSALFLVGSIEGSELDQKDGIVEVGYTASLIGGLVYELYRCIMLVHYISLHEIDILYTRDSPYFAPIVARALTGVSLVIEVNGVPEAEGDESSYQSLQKHMFKFIRSIKRRQAEKIIAVSDGIQGYLLEENPNYDITVIQNGVDTNQFDIISPVKSTAPYTICYVGGLQQWQGVKKMVNVIRRMETEVEFLVIGGTERRCNELRHFIRSIQFEDSVDIVGRISHKDVPQYINKSDLCFGPFVKSRKASPLKIYEYLACGREVVYANEEGLEAPAQLPGVHRLEYSDNDTMAEQIDEVLTNVETNIKGRTRVIESFSWSSVVESILDELKNLNNRDIIEK